jgi:homoserine O-succinyltransferase/O-acetyltransferase
MLKDLRIAILDLYEGEANEGMRCIKELVEQFKNDSPYIVSSEIFDVRGQIEVPSLDFDIYISSGGPGSPLTSEGSEWERKYFNLMEGILQHNLISSRKKFVFLICHSFQIFCRHYGLAKVSKRRSTAFGVMPVHKTRAGQHEHLLNPLADPFWVIDSRDYQITQPNEAAIKKMGGHVLCLEKERPLIPLERAVMSIRFTNEIIGTQFHPEADYNSMFMYLMREDKKKYVIKKYGEKKYQEMLQNLNDPEKIKKTYHAIIPTFLKQIQGHHDRIRASSLQPIL